jgi:hypothetical protein
MPDAPSAREILEGIADELGREFSLVPRIVSGSVDPYELVGLVREARPKAIVVMNNPVLRAFRKYRALAPPSQRGIPAVATLTSFLRETSVGLDNFTGVIYEVPLVTSLTNLRALVDQPIERVGVLYRPLFADFLEEQRALIRAEGFELIGLEVEEATPWAIERGLARLRAEQDVDALWIMNDNVLLARDLLVDGWIPALRGNDVPVVVNVRSLVSRDVSFGTFAVVPDHRALGSQTGQLLWGLADAEWRLPEEAPLEYPVAVEKTLDLDFAREHLALREAELDGVDQLVE